MQGTLPEPALGGQVRAVSSTLSWGGGGDLKSEGGGRETVQKTPRPSLFLHSAPPRNLSVSTKPQRERERSGGGEKETEGGNQRKLQKSMARN